MKTPTGYPCPSLSEQVAWEHLPGEDSEEPRHVGLGVRWFTSHGMGGALSRKLRRGGSAESGFISLEVQLLGILSILDMSPLAILFLAVT